MRMNNVSTQLAHLHEQMEKQAIELLGNLGKALDGLHIALCVFDDHDNTLLWNNEFFTVFPEHSGKVYKGEPYAENLRRFYTGRLGEAELPNVDFYIEAGIARHREQDRPFSFEHHGRHIDASSIRLSGDKRVRVWRMRDSAMYPSLLLPASVPLTSESPASGEAGLFDRLPDGLMTCNQDGLVMRVNESFLAIYELPDREAAVNHSFESIFRLAWAGKTHDDASAALRESGVRTLQENMRFSGAPFELALPGGRYVRISARTTEDRETFYAHVDISELKLREQFQNQKQDRLMQAAEEQIQSLAFSDPLTGLPNRQHLIVLLQQLQLARTQRPGQEALLLVGLDQLKNLNETIGHESSNRLLQSVAQRLGDCTRKGDTLVRLGGNAFVVLLQNLSLLPQQASREAETVAGKILLALSQPYNIGSSDVHCSASIGITLVDNATPQDADVPLNQAELAMRHAKAAGRNELRFFVPQMQADVSARADLERGLREALLNDQFVLHYQAQVTSEGRVFGSEALLRWKHPLRGMVSPAEFIPVAEESGLILPLGNWVLEAACRQLALWAGKPATAELILAVNVSAHQFHQADFVEQVLAALKRSGAKAQRLKLELTESMLVTHVEGTITKMNALKERGIRFSLDDFGTGYSSLSYLKRLPLDQLKIDQSFVRNILTDPGDAAIAKMVIALADSIDLAVIAEGVETEAQRDLLADLGCHNYQGYLFSRPLPVHEFEAFVAQAVGTRHVPALRDNARVTAEELRMLLMPAPSLEKACVTKVHQALS